VLLSVFIHATGIADGTVTSDPAGLSCGGTCGAKNSKGTAYFAKGTTVVLTETPSYTSTFTGWGAMCSGTEKTCTVVMDGDHSVDATFVSKPTYLLFLDSSNNGVASGTIAYSPVGVNCDPSNRGSCGSVDAQGGTIGVEFVAGTVVTIAPNPAPGSRYVWTGACAGSGATCSVTINSNVNGGVYFSN
jgi:hypothetical protein